MPNPDILNRSVTKNDYAESPQGGAFFFAVGNWSRYGSLLPSINGLSARETDYILTSTLDQEAMWAGAVSIALTKLSSMAWEVDGDIPLRVKHGQELMRYADADRGWVSFISKILQDFLLTNNGAFVEIVRATTSSSSKIIGLIPLDSLRCLGKDSRVLLEGGKTRSIYDLVKSGYSGNVVSLDQDGKLSYKKVIGWHETKLDNRYWLRIKLQHGKRRFGLTEGLWVTNDHQLLTDNGWVQADKLTVSDNIHTIYPTLNSEQMQLVTGSILGDGHITRKSRPENYARLAFTHGNAQLEWLELKKKALSGIRFQDNREVPSRNSTQTESESLPCFSDLRDQWYPNNKKVIDRQAIERDFSDLMLAVWYGDDGTMKRGKWGGEKVFIYSLCFSQDDNEWLADFMTSKGIETVSRPAKMNGHTLWELYITVSGTKELFKRIARYLPESMRYKLPENAEKFDPNVWKLGEAKPSYDKIQSIEKGTNGGQLATYCIDVEDTHNFIAGGMVVHNCTRTGNADTPVTYLDLKNRTHELQANEVLTFADMPSNRASMLGSGKCAAARAYQAIYKLASIESYLADKVSGRRPLAVHLINGLNDIQLRSVLQTAQSEADARGAISYMGAIMATIPGETPPSVATVPLADFPDNFDRQKETDISILTYANNLGIDVQDVQPLTGRALGTGAQSETLDEKAKGKGLAAFRQQFQHAMTTWVMEDGVEFNFIESDWRDQEKRASVYGKVGAMVSDSVKNGILTPAQGLQALVDEDIYPKEFLPVDATPDTTLSDTEKIEEPNAEQVAAVPAAPAAPVQVVPPKPLSIPKEMTTTQVELKESQPIQPGTMRVIIKRREGPAHKEAPANSAMMPLLLAAALMNNGEQMKGEDYMNLSEWIASLGKPVTKEKKAEQVKGVEAVMSEDGTSLTILMPADFFSQKQDEKPQDIVINIPAPIVNITNAPPVFNMPAPVINMAPQKAPQVTINPRIEVMMPDPKPAEFEVRRDNYGNVLGIQEKAT